MRSPLRPIAVLALVLFQGCLTQRSIALGQLASSVGKGGAEVGVSTGMLYQTQTQPPVSGIDSGGGPFSAQDGARGFQFPWFEANALFGVSDRVAINVHGSPAGLQPGAKITLTKSRVLSAALLPQLGFGYGSIGQSTQVSGATGVQTETSPKSISGFIFQLGFKFLVSHRSGFFAGAGYDLMLTRSVQTQQKVETLYTSVQHQLSAAAGVAVPIGWLSLRPELALAVVPGISTSSTTGAVTSSTAGGFAFAFLPGFTVAMTSPADPKDIGSEDDERVLPATDNTEESNP